MTAYAMHALEGTALLGCQSRTMCGQINVWVASYGPDDAIARGLHRVFPRPISGRWRRKSEMEFSMLKLAGDLDYQRTLTHQSQN